MRVSSNSTMTDEQSAVFGSEMRRLRKQEGLTLNALGELIGCNGSHVSQLEHGNKKPSPQLAKRIAEVFDLTVSDMLVSHDERLQEIRKKYGKEIRAHREEKGLPMNMVADALGIPLSVYKEYEQGLCSISSRNMDILDRLLGINEEPKVIETKVEVEVPAEIPEYICETILMHIKDLQIDEDEQKEIWRYFSKAKLDAEERKLFG